jgi:hypothetical protein
MTDFSQNIQDFERYGTYTYMFDDVGNLTFNTSSTIFEQVYLGLPLTNVIYNNNKIASFYDVDFVEFVPTNVSDSNVSSSNTINTLQTQLGVVQQENVNLQSQLSELITFNQASSSIATSMAIQQVILELRIALGQGRISSDFSTEFPYTPINAPAVTQSQA